VTTPAPADGEPGRPHVHAAAGQSGHGAAPGPTGARAVVTALPQTGDVQVDEALESLATVRSRPLDEQVEVYVGVHRKLQDRLADLDG
jgi:hypothetical protein